MDGSSFIPIIFGFIVFIIIFLTIFCIIRIRRKKFQMEQVERAQQTQRIQVIICDQNNDINPAATVPKIRSTDELPTYEQAVGQK